jgi:hypothetical protein
MSKTSQYFAFITSLIVLGIFSRFIPHPPNATAVGAVAIFGGFALRHKLSAFAILFAVLFISDLLINNVVYGTLTEGFMWFTSGFGFIYTGFAISILIGQKLKNNFHVKGLGLSILGSVAAFFMLTNFAAWLSLPIYPKNFPGLIAAYVSGLPFALNQLLFTVIYSTVLFGAYGLYTRRFPSIA